MRPVVARAGLAWPSESSRPPSIDAARQAIERWLLANAQLDHGFERGGVAGSIDGDGGEPVYVYPEIAGYFLQWLAWLRARGGAPGQLAARAAACQRWLAHWIERADPPSTRVYLRSHAPDWRNGGVFFFDLAMVLRGVAAAAEAGLIVIDARLVERVVARLSLLVESDGVFAACLPTSPGVLQERWSTRRGGFLAKAAAGLLAAGRTLPIVEVRLGDAARLTLAETLRLAIERPHRETHPLLYAVEGALAADAEAAAAPYLDALALQLGDVLHACAAHGMPNECLDGTGVPRVDSAAQCVRAAVLLQAAHPRWCADSLSLHRVTHAISRLAYPDGSLPFDADGHAKQRCVWAAMFAHQALALAGLACDDPLLRDARRWIV